MAVAPILINQLLKCQMYHIGWHLIWFDLKVLEANNFEDMRKIFALESMGRVQKLLSRLFRETEQLEANFFNWSKVEYNLY